MGVDLYHATRGPRVGPTIDPPCRSSGAHRSGVCMPADLSVLGDTSWLPEG